MIDRELIVTLAICLALIFFAALLGYVLAIGGNHGPSGHQDDRGTIQQAGDTMLADPTLAELKQAYPGWTW